MPSGGPAQQYRPLEIQPHPVRLLPVCTCILTLLRGAVTEGEWWVGSLDELHGDKEGRPSWQETEQRMKDLTGYWFERTLGTRIEVAKNEGGVISAWRVMLVSVTGMLGTRATGRHQNVGVFSCRFSRICRHVGQAEPQKARSQRWCWFLLGAARATEVWTSSDGEACESNPNRRGL